MQMWLNLHIEKNRKMCHIAYVRVSHLLATFNVLPFVQHHFLTAKKCFATNFTVVRICGTHKFHDTLLDVETSDFPFPKRMQRNKLSNVMAANSQRRLIGLKIVQQFRQVLDSPKVIRLKFVNV